MAIRVLVCDDHSIVRQGLVALLATDPGIEVVGEAEDGWAAIDAAKRLAPDVVLMDLSLPLLNGLDATRRIVDEDHRVRVLILSMHDDGISVRRAMEAGAAGYLVKGVGLDTLVQTLERVAAGERAFGPGFAASPEPSKPLTPREREVLQLVGEGYTNREIGLLLGISPKTVEKHRANLMDKLDAPDTASLTRWAVALGLVEVTGPAG